MSSQESELRDGLKEKGINFILVSDSKNKQTFDNFAKEHKAQGFPHSVVISNGKKVGELPGFMPGHIFIEKVETIIAPISK